MDPFELKLPKSEEELIILYKFFDQKTDETWKEYLYYCEGIMSYPKAELIFPIIFNEINFCEEMMARIRVHLSAEAQKDIDYDDFSTW